MAKRSEQLLLKAACQLFQRLRQLEAVVLTVLTMDSTHPFIGHIEGIQRGYGAACRRDGKGHSHGGPAPHNYIRMITYLMTEAVNDIGRANRDYIQTFYEPISKNEVEMDEIADVARVVRVTRCYKDPTAEVEIRKILLAITNDELQKTLTSALVMMGAKRRHGSAPRGDLERELGKLIQPRKA